MWLLLIAVVPAIVGLVLLLVWLVRRFVPGVSEGFDAEVASQMLGVVAALFGLLLAFIIVIAYQNYGDTQGRVSDEAERYAEQNETDYTALKKAAESGRVAVQTGA